MAIAMDSVAEPTVIPDLQQLEARLGERLLADRKLSPPIWTAPRVCSRPWAGG